MRRTMLLTLVRQDFRDRFSGSVLGMWWLIVGPLVQIIIFTLVFGRTVGSRIPGTESIYAYGLYLVSGLLPWTAFASTISRTTTVFVDKRAILTKFPVRLIIVAGHIAVAETIILVAVLSLFLAMMVLAGTTPKITSIQVLLLIPFQQLMAFLVGLTAAMFTLVIRDVRELVGVGLFIWFWATPIVYLSGDPSGFLRAAQDFNPAFWFVEEYHKSLVYGQSIEYDIFALRVLGASAIFFGLAWLLHRWERPLRDLI